METVKELIVDVNPTEVSIALMENHRLIELNKESILADKSVLIIAFFLPLMLPLSISAMKRKPLFTIWIWG